MTAQGRANYEAYRKASGVQLPEYDTLSGAIRHAWDAGADAVEQWLSELPVDEDMPGGEPKAAKVIVVIEAGGHERRYEASEFSGGTSGLDISRDGRVIAIYPGEHSWLSVREEGSTVPDGIARALGIARRALSEIVRRSDDGGDQPFGRPEIGDLASTALNGIWTETEG